MTEKVIDFHVHPFRREAYLLNFYPGTEAADADRMRNRLKDAGISHICGSVVKREGCPESFADIRALNREALVLKQMLRDFYTPGFHIHPGFVQASCEEVEFMHRNGVHLMGELVPYMHGWGDFNPQSWMQIMDAAESYGMVCSYHTPFAFDMDRMVGEHPGVIFVAAHPGDRERVPEHIAMMKKHENLYLDLSGTGLFRLGMLKYLVQAVGAERILFGSDYPICNPGMYIQAVLTEDISEADKERILWGNAQRLLTERLQ